MRQIRGSQWKAAWRASVELTRKVGYRIDADAEGLLIVLEPAATAQAEKPAAKPRETKAKVPATPAAAESPAPLAETSRREALATDPVKTEVALDTETMAAVASGPPPASEPKAVPASVRAP